MSDPHELERFDRPSDAFEAAEWVVSAASEFGRACGALLRLGLAVRVSPVGYGRALRFAVTDTRGWTRGWTLGGHDELQAFCRGLLAPGADQFVLGALERPQKRR